jgi:hypothetical protein
MKTNDFPGGGNVAGRRLKRRNSPAMKLATLAVTVIMCAASLVAARPVLAAPDVTLSATYGSPGTALTVSGIGFTAGDTYTITFAPGTYYAQTLIADVVITGDSFSQTVAIPPAPWALQTIQISTNRGTFLRNFQIIPDIELSSEAGYVGDTIAVNGYGFRASADVNIIFNNTVVAIAASDTYGTLNQSSFRVPAIRSGSYNLNGNDSVAASADIVFTVRTRLVLGTTQGTVGSQISLAGTGYDYNSVMTFFWDGEIITTNQIVTSSTGAFSANLTAPPGTTGTHTIRAADYSTRYASASFTIFPSLALTPATGAPGSTVTITGRGFRPNDQMSITYNGAPLATQPPTPVTDAAGSFSATFTVPAGTSGNYIVRASDGVFVANATFAVALNITVVPAIGSVGTGLTISGSGFTPSGQVVLSYDGQDFATVSADANGAVTASFKVPASKAGAHTISVRDLSVAGLIATATFNIESTPPPRPNLLAPEPGTQASTTPVLTWSAVTDPSGVTYSLQVAKDANFSNMVLSQTGLIEAQYAVSPGQAFALVKKSSPFYWRVKAIDGAGNESPWSSTGTFYTQDSAPPPVPLLLSPQDGSQADVRPAFDWSDVSDPSGVSYSLQVARDKAFSQQVLSLPGITTSGYQVAASEAFELMKKSSPYYWRVKAVDGAGNESDWTAPFSFYTQDSTPPPAPTPLRPEPGSLQSGQTFFDWTDVTDPSGVTYSLQVSLDSAFSRLVASEENLTTSEYRLSKTEKLSSSTGNTPDTYYWRVKAVDGAANESAWSSGTEFKVKGFLQSGWPLYVAIGIGGLLLLALGVFIGIRLKPKPTS